MIPSTAMTDAQRKLLFSQMEKENIDKVALEDRLGFSIGELSKQEASALIDCLMSEMEIIKRESEVKKERLDTSPFSEHMQVSYNSYGHLAIRFFNLHEADDDQIPKKSDTLIVFTMTESRELIRFIQEKVKL